MNTNYSQWKRGLKDGVPICLGYLAVSFTFGMAAGKGILTPLSAVIMSAANLTSAGQFAALSLIGASASYLEMAFTQLVINLRYCLMSCALSQKLAPQTTIFQRLVMSFGISDEIFGLSACIEGRLSPFYTYGLMSVAIPGWVGGTFLGIMSGTVLPARLASALGIALYGMFMAVIIPPAAKDRFIGGLILISMLLSFALSKIPLTEELSPGFKIIFLTLLIAGAAAVIRPIEEDSIAEVSDGA